LRIKKEVAEDFERKKGKFGGDILFLRRVDE